MFTVAQKKSFFFFARLILIYLLWYLMFEFWILPYTRIHEWFTSITADLSFFLMNFLGLLSVKSTVNELGVVTLFHGDTGKILVSIGHGCNALSLFVLFSGFILAFPSKIKLKVPFLFIGLGILFILNILRIIIITLMWNYNPRWVDFNHKYVFTTFMYLVIFGLWILWVNRLDKNKQNQV